MNNLHINYAETIFEPFYDCGESYPEHRKYSRLSDYEMKFAEGADCKVEDDWFGSNVYIYSQPADTYAVSFTKNCDLDIEDFDIFRFCGIVNESIKLRFTCTVDGEEQVVLECAGKGKRDEYDGRISGKKITRIKMEFMNTQKVEGVATLHWLGLSNLEKQTKLRNTPSGMTSKWEGCFNETFEVSPMIGIWFDSDELEKLRKRLDTPEYKNLMDDCRTKAESYLDVKPEEVIGDYVPIGSPSIRRSCDRGRDVSTTGMRLLAFVGIIDKNIQMLKMACRMALSLSCMKSWSDTPMELLPGTTWCHRSFSHNYCCQACVAVLDWAGSLLTWHGKNIIYEALMMKGLPRLEADFKTVEYIRHMNQGAVFSNGRILALMALGDRYPRYKALLDEAEKDFYEILDDYVASDGGAIEGPGYWGYTLCVSIPTLYILSKYRKKPFLESVPESILRTEKYGLAHLSDSEDFEFMAIGDSRYHKKFEPIIAQMYSVIGKSDIWKPMYKKFLKENGRIEFLEEFIIEVPDIDSADIKMEDFITLNETGQTAVRFESENGLKTHLHLVSGELYFGHTHEDKGSFILEVNGEMVLIDRGTCGYDSSYGALVRKSEYHNILCPVDENGKAYSQPCYPEVYGGRVIKSEKINGIFNYETDLSNAWEKGVFKKASRRIEMKSAESFTVYDDVVYANGKKQSMFLLNTHGNISRCDEGYEIAHNDIKITVIPKNWIPEKAVIGEFGIDDDLKPVNRLALYTDKCEKYNIITEIKITRCEAK